ncbi:MAG: hypothetical protein RLZZ292_291 [Bacteroidota bacterium]|jgi:hypothetical protein
MKKKISLLLLIVLFSGCFNQIVSFKEEHSTFAFIDNKKISYCVVFRLYSDNERPYHKFATITNLSKEQGIWAKEIKYEQWMKLLEDSQKDWAAHVILGAMFDQFTAELDAMKHLRNKVSRWRKISKKEDILFWKEYLKKVTKINEIIK